VKSHFASPATPLDPPARASTAAASTISRRGEPGCDRRGGHARAHPVGEGQCERAAAQRRLDRLQAGPFLGDPAADGRRLSLRGADLIRVRDGRITDIHHVETLLATLRMAGSA
jgi:hypothetical protein